MTRVCTIWLGLLILTFAAACPEERADAGADDGGSEVDCALTPTHPWCLPDLRTDGGQVDDAGPPPDAGRKKPSDAGSPPPPDAGAPLDAGSGPDGGGLDEETLCIETAGRWEPTSCGHYVCGAAPPCTVVDPGCNCGMGKNWVPGQGCVDDAACLTADDEAKCAQTAGTWDDASCGHYTCGAAPTCGQLDPGCDCGPTKNFVVGFGCALDLMCLDEEGQCTSTGGTWDAAACMHYVCGAPNDCQSVIPGCNCGATANFDPGQGCVVDPLCGG